MLRVQLQHAYPEGLRLDLDLELALSGVTALFGPSGSGKSTVLDCIAGLRRELRGGRVSMNGECWQNENSWLPPWQRGLAYVSQDPNLFPHLSVGGNLDFAIRRARSGGPTRGQVCELLELDSLLSREPTTLSGGEQQRVAIGRALLSYPRLLLLDEPLSGLDRRAAKACLASLVTIQRELELPMLFVSHQLEEVQAIADHLVIMEQGKIIGQGSLFELSGRLDSGLAEDEAAAAIIEVSDAQDDARYGLCSVTVDGERLWIPGSAARRPRRLRIPARDVSVCREMPRDTSILNIIPATLEGTQDTGPAHCLLRLRLHQQYLLARITRRSRDELGLGVGDSLYAQIKSSALLQESETR
ncbi:MAG: molybdenum ABC transporter ATP-binding protein [Pseudomonadota bacterium]